jgi:hypothetical protein
MNDAHCHFFSTPFFAALGRQLKGADEKAPHETALAKLGWDAPGTAEALADRWVAELDRAGVGRAVIIASVPGDAGSVAAAVKRHPRRLVGFSWSIRRSRTRPHTAAHWIQVGCAVCLFPAIIVSNRR